MILASLPLRTALSALACALTSSLVAQEVTLESLPRLRATEELRIGDANDPQRGFSIISNLTVDRDGNVYVFDMPGMNIRVFSPSGAPLRTIGRKGEGPGEFGGAVGLQMLGDTIVAIGGGEGGCREVIYLFARDGSHLSTATATGVRLALHSGVGVVAPRLVRPDGLISGSMNCFTGGAAPGLGSVRPTDTLRIPRVLFDLKGTPVDTIGFDLRFPPAPRVTRETVMIEGRSHPIPGPLDDARLDLTTFDGRIHVERKRPQNPAQALIRISRLRTNGDTASTRVLRYSPRRYTDAGLDSVAAGSARVPGGSYRIIDGVPQITPYANPEAAALAIRERLKFPQYATPVTQGVFGNDQSVWLQLSSYEGGGANHWLVIDNIDRARGVVELPKLVRIGWVSGDVVWGILNDEDDVPFVVRYRLSR